MSKRHWSITLLFAAAIAGPGIASAQHHRDRDNLGPWSDIYSIGAAMYACLAGAATASRLPPCLICKQAHNCCITLQALRKLRCCYPSARATAL